MKKKLVQMLGILSAVVMLAGCTGKTADIITSEIKKPDTTNTVTTNADSDAVNLSSNGGGLSALGDPSEKEMKAVSKSAFELFDQVLKNEDKDSNVLLSPSSIMLALAMTENGADGETLKQLEKTVNGGLDIDEMNEVMSHTANRLNNAEEVDWDVANSVWFKDDGAWEMKQDFVNKVVSYYNAEIWKAPFNNQTLNDINGWVNDKTHGMIPSILDDIPDDARMYLINAIAFEGEWLNEYEDTQVHENETFTNSDGSVSDVTMLSSSENSYIELGKGIGFIKPYKGGEYSFVGILPDEGVSTEEYVASVIRSGDAFSDAIVNRKYGDVVVRMPEFENDYGIELSDTYKALGMDVPFDEGSADFTNMMNPLSGDPFKVWIGRILHKTHIEVDRKGTKAAAVTAVEMMAAGCAAPSEEMPIFITLDRPFVYAIVENETGMPIFLGCQNSMK